MTDDELKIQAMIRFWKELSSSEQHLKLCEGCQIRWERDKAMEQLAEHHIPFMCVAEDVVDVVRCKDCKHWHEDVANNFTSIPRGGCKLIRGITNGEFFCALGERKEINSR